MTTIEIERKMSDAFHGGEVLRRELRLTREEAEYVSTHYPVCLTPMGGGEGPWFEMIFQGVG